MSPPSLRRVARLALALAPLVACSQAASDACPGVQVARLALLGTRNLASDPLAPEIPACTATVGYGELPVAITGELAQDPAGPGAAFCKQPPAAILFGAREGDAFTLQGETGGAVLAGCGATCSANLTVILRGTLAPASGGAAAAFDGTYIERLDRAAGDCGGCTLPCDGRYDVTGDATP